MLAEAAVASPSRRHRRRRRPPPDVGGGRRCDLGASPGLRRAARDLHRRRPSPFRGSRAGGAGARRRDRLARLFPVGDLPASPDDDPRLQPRGEGSEWPHAEQLLAALRESFAVGAVGPAGRPGCFGRIRHVPRRPLVPADAPSELVPQRPDRPPAVTLLAAQRARAPLRHRGSAHRQAHRFRRRQPRPGELEKRV